MLPKIDAHVHILGPKRPAVEVLKALNIQKVVNICYSSLESPDEIQGFEKNLLEETDIASETFLFCSSFNVTKYQEEDYVQQVIEKLERDFTQRSAVAVKMWKDVGMLLKDQERYVYCDDRRFEGIFKWLNERAAVVYLHIADPLAGWLPLDPGSPHYNYYKTFPEFYWYNKPDRPSHSELLAHRDNLVARWPNIRFVCAHLANLCYDTDKVAEFLENHPNASVDTAARQADFMLQKKEKVRDFFVRFQDRILYGTDWSTNVDTWGQDESLWPKKIEKIVNSVHWSYRYFEEDLDLPDEVLRKFYFDNARTVLSGSEEH